MSAPSSESKLIIHQDRLTGEITHASWSAEPAEGAQEISVEGGSAPRVAVLTTESGRAAPEDRVAALRPFLLELERVLEERKRSTAERSYTRSLFEAGAPRIGEKLTEEAGELGRAIAGESDERVANEAADLVYHMLVALRFRSVSLREVVRVLAGRSGTSGHAEKASRGRRD